MHNPNTKADIILYDCLNSMACPVLVPDYGQTLENSTRRFVPICKPTNACPYNLCEARICN